MVKAFSEMTMAMKRLIRAVVIGILLAPAAAWAQSTDEVVYYHTDAIGSVRMITDAAGAMIERYDFLPFGESWDPPPNPDVRQFAGKERDTETGLDYFGARYYRAQSGRFTTVDPVLDIAPALLDPQRWNRYVYARNNPLRYIDPTGESIELLGNEEVRRTALEALRSAVGRQAGSYLYENKITGADGMTRYFVGIRSGGPDGSVGFLEHPSAAIFASMSWIRKKAMRRFVYRGGS